LECHFFGNLYAQDSDINNCCHDYHTYLESICITHYDVSLQYVTTTSFVLLLSHSFPQENSIKEIIESQPMITYSSFHG
jgi:hypothetical protein